LTGQPVDTLPSLYPSPNVSP